MGGLRRHRGVRALHFRHPWGRRRRRGARRYTRGTDLSPGLIALSHIARQGAAFSRNNDMRTGRPHIVSSLAVSQCHSYLCGREIRNSSLSPTLVYFAVCYSLARRQFSAPSPLILFVVKLFNAFIRISPLLFPSLPEVRQQIGAL